MEKEESIYIPKFKKCIFDPIKKTSYLITEKLSEIKKENFTSNFVNDYMGLLNYIKDVHFNSYYFTIF